MTRFFNDFPTDVERCFTPEDLEPIRYDKRGASLRQQTAIDNRYSLRWSEKMKTPRLVLALLALTFALAPQSPRTAFAQAYRKKYSAKLISPRPGQVLNPGQVVRIAWTADFPDVDLSMCETEVLLSLDGGRTIYMR